MPIGELLMVRMEVVVCGNHFDSGAGDDAPEEGAVHVHLVGPDQQRRLQPVQGHALLVLEQDVRPLPTPHI